MTLKLYNTLTKQKEEFVPIHGNRVNMFVCGPTVYDYSHLGHARTYIVFDVIARYLRYRGYSVFYLMNITDVDDKMIKRANETGLSVKGLADRFTDAFHEDMKRLNVMSVNLYAKATEHVDEIISQIKTLIEKGFAYDVDGDVYFEVRKFKDFGKLSKQALDELKAGARIEVDEKKRRPEDFALWKKQKPDEPFWASPWGNGRPGWHVEDTAITTTYFGNKYDLHGGGIDLLFPHHESEIAIAESATGEKPFVKYWVHSGFLTLNKEKMSKSLGNFFTIREVLEKYESEVIRFFMLNAHYRSPIDFSDKGLDEAKQGLERIKNTVDNIKAAAKNAGEGSEGNIPDIIAEARQKFLDAMDDDFNTREAISAVFELTKSVNQAIPDGLSSSALNMIISTYKELGGIIGLFQDEKKEGGITGDLISLIVEIRENARKNKDWETSDKIRNKLKVLGIVVEDAEDGPQVKIR
ncbi:MAG: cysteine--tRNA ligase [Thermoplasmatales archaeon]|nr:cysteine--tRNA ligase [Thermoplasmatales archaeon]